MEQLVKAIIEGGTVPRGSVRVSGAKNAATRMLAAALLTDSGVELGNFPTRLVDVGHKIRFIRSVGGEVVVDHDNDSIAVKGANYGSLVTADYDIPIRTTYLLVAGQILRNGIARIPYPGGCKIGARGYDMHIMVWRQLGCEVIEQPDFIEVRGNFRGGEIHFPISTVGGTENAIMCASVAQGTTEITNAYITPEIENLIDLLLRMGASIEVIGNSRITVVGKPDGLAGARMRVMPDRIEALTWIVYAILSGGTVLVEGVPFAALQSPLLYLESAGVDLLTNTNSAYVHPAAVRSEGVQPFEVPCGAHPGVISDMQPFYVMLALAAAGTSRIFDYRYPERIGYVKELAKFCASGNLEGEHGKITVAGPVRFQAAEAWSTDLRGSMALILAGLLADGTSIVHDAHMALRGYNNLPGKLDGLGIKVTVVEDDVAPLAKVVNS